MGRSFDFSKLRKAVCEAARSAFSEMRKAHKKETFYVFALYTTPDASYLVPSANTEQGLAKTVKKYRQQGTADESLPESLRWNAPDWAYHCEGESHFQSVQDLLDGGPSIDDMTEDDAEIHVGKLMTAFMNGLRDLDREEFFGTGGDREQIVLLLTMGDQEESLLLECAKKLNPSKIYKRFAAAYDLATQGQFTEIGSRKVYQMSGVSVSQDGSLLAAVGSDAIVTFSVPEYRELFKKRIGRYQHGYYSVWCSALAPDGNQLAFGWKSGSNDDSSIERWSLSRKKRLPDLPVFKGGIWTVAYSPDSKVLAGGGQDQCIRLWDTEAGSLISELAGHKNGLRCIRFSPDGKQLASIDRGDGSLHVWDLEKQRVTLQLDDQGDSVSYSHDGRRIAVCSGAIDKESRQVRVWDVHSGKLLQRIGELSQRADVVEFSPDGRLLAVGSGCPGTVELWEHEKNRRIDLLNPKYEQISALAFIPGQEKLAVVGRGLRRLPVLIWSYSSGSN